VFDGGCVAVAEAPPKLNGFIVYAELEEAAGTVQLLGVVWVFDGNCCEAGCDVGANVGAVDEVGMEYVLVAGVENVDNQLVLVLPALLALLVLLTVLALFTLANDTAAVGAEGLSTIGV
jgi:hypothetical protein